MSKAASTPAKKDDRNDQKNGKNDNKSHNDNNFCAPSRSDCKDDRKDDHKDDHKNDKDKGHNGKPSIWNCDDGFWGTPHHNNNGGHNGNNNGHHGCNGNDNCTTTEVTRTFTGNTFPTNLAEGQHIDAAGQAALGELASNMQVSADTHVSGQVTFEQAGYDNTLGVFTITCDGHIQAVEMAVANTENVGATFEIDTGPGASELGFFLLPDGWNRFGGYESYDIDAGSLKFVTDYGTPDAAQTKVTDDGNNVTLVFTTAEGQEVAVPGPYWFTSDRGGSNSLNIDGDVHTLSGVDGADNTTLKIAFEDWPSSKSDYDYNDTVFTVKMTEEVKSCEPSCDPNPCHPQPNPCQPEPSCDPQPHCDVRNIIDFGDCVTQAISHFVNTTTSSVVTQTSTVVQTTAAAVLSTVTHISDEVHVNQHHG